MSDFINCYALVQANALASRTVCGAEIATGADTAAMNTLRNNTAMNVNISGVAYEYKFVAVHHTVVDEFINSYNNFYFSGTSVYRSAGVQTHDRNIPAGSFDRTIPYVEVNMMHSLV